MNTKNRETNTECKIYFNESTSFRNLLFALDDFLTHTRARERAKTELPKIEADVNENVSIDGFNSSSTCLDRIDSISRDDEN